MARRKRDSIHYVNNADFSQAVVEYVKTVNTAKENNVQLPIIPDYIAQCFLRIAQGLSYKSNFIRYTYREEMVMDAVENCLKAIYNYNIETATRTGKPNAFAYFTQISWFAFLRRIAKEKKHQDVKLKYLTESGMENFIMNELDAGGISDQVAAHYIDTLQSRIEKIKDHDADFKEYVKEEKRKRKQTVDSDLSDFMQ